ncbi:MAG: hypothetical protein ABIR50_10860 [Ginsengibacter sp.]
MKKRFLIKASILFSLQFLLLFLKLNVNSVNALCDYRSQCGKEQNNRPPLKINSFTVFPFDDLLIKI